MVERHFIITRNSKPTHSHGIKGNMTFLCIQEQLPTGKRATLYSGSHFNEGSLTPFLRHLLGRLVLKDTSTQHRNSDGRVA